MDSLIQLLSSFVVTLVLTLLSLWVIMVIRSGINEPDRRGFTSAVASSTVAVRW